MSKFEAILPLSDIQQALLLHKQFAKKDEGELHVRFTISGKLNPEKIKATWTKIAQIHPTLRTTIHWEKVKSPVQIVHHNQEFPIEFLAYTNEQEILKGITNDLKVGYNLNKVYHHPIRVYSDGTQHHVVWFCHHIHLDGWSTGQILKDWHSSYHENAIGFRPTMQQFIKWKKSNIPSLSQFNFDSILNTERFIPVSTSLDKNNHSTSLPSSQASRVKNFVKQNGITLNILFLGAWAATIHSISNKDQVSIANTVSGRDVHFEGIQTLVGLLSNIVPVFSKHNDGTDIIPWLNDLQLNSVKNSSLSHYGAHEVQKMAREKNKEFHLQTLYTFENFPWEDLTNDTLSISNFKSGATSNFPLSVVIIPHDTMSIHLASNSRHIDANMLDQISQIYLEKIHCLLDLNLNKLWDFNPLWPEFHTSKSKDPVAPQGALEFQLLTIWKEILSLESIGVTDDYFTLGGKSIQALQMFSVIEQRTGHKVSPAILLEHSSIRALAEFISGGSSKNWSALVPLGTGGKGHPLFCIHAGGAHVFIYRLLAQTLSTIRPVFGIQPYGLDGNETHNNSIEEMASAYLDEIRKVQPSGPIHVLGYCFSAAIVAQMSVILKKEKRDHTIIVVDSAPSLTYGRNAKTLRGKITKILRIVRSSQWPRFYDILIRKWFKLKINLFGKFDSEQVKNQRKIEAILSNVYKKFEWKKQETILHLIRSEEFANRSDKNVHVEWWKHLVDSGLRTYQIKGRHSTLFESDSVSELAKQVNDILISNE